MQLVKRLGGVVEVGVGSNPDGAQLVHLNSSTIHCTFVVVLVVVLLFYIHGKHLRSCRDSQLS